VQCETDVSPVPRNRCAVLPVRESGKVESRSAVRPDINEAFYRFIIDFLNSFFNLHVLENRIVG
jgi:hypothetical protein